MNLYKIWQEVNKNYDSYDSAIVAAESQEDAKRILPMDLESRSCLYGDETPEEIEETKNHVLHREWCNPENVQVEYIGIAKDGTQPGVILASFNAG